LRKPPGQRSAGSFWTPGAAGATAQGKTIPGLSGFCAAHSPIQPSPASLLVVEQCIELILAHHNVRDHNFASAGGKNRHQEK
jgi:hypothetical protein